MAEHVLAVDLGGTKVDAALVADDGTIVAGSRHRAPTGPEASAADLSDAVAGVVAQAAAALAGGDRIRGLGIGSAGPVDAVAGTVSPLNLRIAQFPLVAVAAGALGADVPVRLGLDGLCIALAEARYGAAADAASSVSLVVSTGIGGGIVWNGMPLAGERGNAGHLGQVRVTMATEGGPRTGTLEDVAAGPGSVRWANAQGWVGRAGEDLARDAAAGDAVARAAIVRSATAVGHALAGVSALLDIDRFVIGGGFSHAADDYIDLVQTTARSLAILPATYEIDVRRAALGADAPLVGAACLIPLR
ncbi:ROK family protein [Microbacterium sp. cx-59]|uniref:ROK family protein n=1 Tax=Microbacterium sp. cx-59 TaxID=2891207 RepID=UPI001E50143D|nr:ROK family protein [Microbacterium sp. cx-59]MCC4908317.1 ROK family protein [Microbacterium sp. cx-59]